MVLLEVDCCFLVISWFGGIVVDGGFLGVVVVVGVMASDSICLFVFGGGNALSVTGGGIGVGIWLIVGVLTLSGSWLGG